MFLYKLITKFRLRADVILQPSSTKDATSFDVFPAAPLILPHDVQKAFPNKVHLVPDPAVIHVNGVEIALTNSEVKLSQFLNLF